jgi:hypothetical protein
MQLYTLAMDATVAVGADEITFVQLGFDLLAVAIFESHRHSNVLHLRVSVVEVVNVWTCVS